MKLIRDLSRSKLIEGRSSGISFALCKLEGNELKEIMPLSACKDYLSDAVWAEKYMKKSQLIHGFSHEPQGILKDKMIYLSTATVSSDKKSEPTSYGLTNHVKFINQVEEALGLVHTSIVETDAYPVLMVDGYWAQQPYLISMYTLLFRIANDYGDQSVVDYIKSKEYIPGKEHLSSRAVSNIMYLLDGGEAMDQGRDRTIHNIHNHGIKTVNLKLMHEQGQAAVTV